MLNNNSGESFNHFTTKKYKQVKTPQKPLDAMSSK